MQDEKLEKLAQRYHLKLLLLFGSRAAGSPHRRSDFDIAFYAEKDLDLTDEARMIVDLAPAVKIKSDDIDLVNMKTAPPLLRYAIFLHPKILYVKDMFFFYHLRTYAFKEYVEAKPLFAARSRRLKERFGSANAV